MKLDLGSPIAHWADVGTYEFNSIEYRLNTALDKRLTIKFDWNLRAALLSLNGGIKPHFQEAPDILISGVRLIEGMR